MALPKLKDIKWVTTDCYGTLIDWEKGISDAFKKEADRDGLTIDEGPFLERFFENQAQIMSGSYELYAEVLRRAAVQTAEEIGWTIEPSRAQFLPDSVGSWPPFREANAAMDRLKERYDIGIITSAPSSTWSSPPSRSGATSPIRRICASAPAGSAARRAGCTLPPAMRPTWSPRSS
jgi:2-haloacid dehalogenase/putative hydrolase of the HAD superfamily